MSKPLMQLPTRRVAFGKQLDLLRGYAAGGADGHGVTNDELGDIVGLAPKTASLVNSFFIDVGFIHRTERGNIPAPEVVAFQRAYQWDQDGAGKELAPILREAWFYGALKSKLSYGPLSEQQAVGVLGQRANANQDFYPELRLLLDFLETALLITRENGMVEIEAKADLPSDPSRTAEPDVGPKPMVPRPQEAPTGATSRGSLPLLIQGLLEQLPKDGHWTVARKKQWLDMASLTFDLVYTVDTDFAPDPDTGGES